jgi:stage II sporulation protein D
MYAYVRRGRFIGISAAAAVMAPRAARATGGLDIESAESVHPMRVLLATGAASSPETVDDWHFMWEGRAYRGSFSTVRLPDGRDGLINTLPLDSYLYGVLAKEVSPSWPAAAQQAQAIVSRTYALIKLRPANAYDVVAGESYQQYAGIEGESVQGRAAIDATGGVVLTYGGMPAHVAYSSCCGGKTAAAGDVWNTPFPYLPSIPDPNCMGSPYYDWTASVQLAELEGAFPPCGGIGSLRSVALEATPGDRPTGISFVGSSSTFATTPKALRDSLGAAVIRSTFVRGAALEAGGASVALTGTGRGHGVGMCQWGARGLAGQGAGAHDILAFYFPGTEFGSA